MATITDIDIVPNPSGCGHAELRMLIDGQPFQLEIMRESFRLETVEDVRTAAINHIRAHIKESGLTLFSLIRADLRTRSFKI